MNSTKGDAPVIGPTEASISNPSDKRKIDMANSKAAPARSATKASTAEILPTAAQLIHLAIQMAENNITRLIDIRNNDDEWDDADVDVDMATELALEKVLSLKGKKFTEINDFLSKWYMAQSAMNLAKKAFSRENCWYSRILANSTELFDQMAHAIEFADARATEAA